MNLHMVKFSKNIIDNEWESIVIQNTSTHRSERMIGLQIYDKIF